jgi:ACT domain-containing protein
MIVVTGNEGNTIYYKCSCGAQGKCMIKPMSVESAIVVDVECAMPTCFETERVVLVQYKNEESKNEIMKNLNEVELSWSLVLSNEIV